MNPEFQRVLDGESFRAVAADLAINESTLRRRFRDAGLSVNRSRGGRPQVDTARAVALWHEHHNIARIANLVGASETAVSNALIRGGITRDTNHPPRKGAQLTPRQATELHRLHDAMPDHPTRDGSPDRSSVEFIDFCAFVLTLHIDHHISLNTSAAELGRSRSALSRWLRESGNPLPLRTH